MQPNEYMKAALAKEADQERIYRRRVELGVPMSRLENGLRGLENEVGELADIVKGVVEYGRPLDPIHVIEECGDALWRISQVLASVGGTLEGAMAANLRKLAVRFKDQCVDHTEADRLRAAERAALEQRLDEGATIVQDGHGFGHVEYDGGSDAEG